MNITITLSAEDIKSIIKDYVANNFSITPNDTIFTVGTDDLINCIIKGTPFIKIKGAPFTKIETKEEK